MITHEKLQAELDAAAASGDVDQLRRIGRRAAELAEASSGPDAAALVAIALDAARAARGGAGRWKAR